MKTFSLLVLVALAESARAEEPTFEALGQAPIVQGDRVRARERAFDEAMRQAVEQATATVLDPDALVQRSSDLRLRIYPRAQSYVATYHVLDEGEVATGATATFQVHLSAQVSTARLQRDLTSPQAAASSAPKARALVCSTAVKSGELEVRGAAEIAVRQLLQAHAVELLAPPAACSEETAAQAARALGAQGAVIAVVSTQAAGPIRGTVLVSARSHARLELVDPDGRSSADAEADRDAYDASLERAAGSAARKAGEEAARELEPRLIARWPSASATGAVRVHLTGLARYADYVAVTRALHALPGVAAVEPRRFSRGEADLWVRTASQASQLAEALRRVPPQGPRVTIAQPGADALEVRITEGTVIQEPG